MMIYECLMLMLMLCKSSYARLTPKVLHKGGADCSVDEPLHADYRCILPHWPAAVPAQTVELSGHLPWTKLHSASELTESSLQ